MMSVRISDDLRELRFQIKLLPNVGNVYLSIKRVNTRYGEKALLRIFIVHKKGDEEDVFREFLKLEEVRELGMGILTITSSVKEDWKYYIRRIRENLSLLEKVLEVKENE